MKKEETKDRKNKGITMIVLVITILVLLILARSKYSNANSDQMGYYRKQMKQKAQPKWQMQKKS